ncbi:MAG TPA: PIN domain-containing protein [Thermoanaerobaculia bacterium]|jgi:predicted nucleic acid-binding protein|nr:PIN domain-containing protein [Thermoanaerobaculia bacterium]
MTSRKIRVFLDTNVLLAYFQGKAELQHLFSEEVRERAAFAVNGIVLQELLLSQVNDRDLAAMEPYVEIEAMVPNPESPELQAMLRDVRNHSLHVNDILILATARSYDVLLTYDRDLLQAGNAVLRSETPEEFLVELGAAA